MEARAAPRMTGIADVNGIFIAEAYTIDLRYGDRPLNPRTVQCPISNGLFSSERKKTVCLVRNIIAILLTDAECREHKKQTSAQGLRLPDWIRKRLQNGE